LYDPTNLNIDDILRGIQSFNESSPSCGFRIEFKDLVHKSYKAREVPIYVLTELTDCLNKAINERLERTIDPNDEVI
jgi:hypothetical protein